MTTWKSWMVMGQPWWRRAVAPPCQTASQAPATLSSSSSFLTTLLQRLVGVLSGGQWHQNQVSEWVQTMCLKIISLKIFRWYVAVFLSSDCEFGEWGSWTTCSAPCGGTRMRKRGVEPCLVSPSVSVSANALLAPFGGAFLSSSGCQCRVEREACNTEHCISVDCAFGPWSDWNSCSATCGSGTKTRRRGIERQPRGNGKPCLGDRVDRRPCNTARCPR